MTSLVRAAITAAGRRQLARAARDGLGILPVRFTLGSGWNTTPWDPTLTPIPDTAEDSTETSSEVFSGGLDTGELRVESANSRVLVVACYGPTSPTYDIQELMVWARLQRTPVAEESLREFPFACAVFPNWYHSTSQRFCARVVIPLG